MRGQAGFLCLLLFMLPKPSRQKPEEQSERSISEKERESRSQANAYQALLAKAKSIGRRQSVLLLRHLAIK